MQGGVRKGLLAEAAEFVLEVVVPRSQRRRLLSPTLASRAAAAMERAVSRASMARSCEGVRPSLRTFDEFIAVRLVDDNFFMMRNSPHVYATRPAGVILGS